MPSNRPWWRVHCPHPVTISAWFLPLYTWTKWSGQTQNAPCCRNQAHSSLHSCPSIQILVLCFTTTVTLINCMPSPLLNYNLHFLFFTNIRLIISISKPLVVFVIHTSDTSTPTNFSHGPHPVSFLVMQHLTRVIFASILQLAECISLGM